MTPWWSPKKHAQIMQSSSNDPNPLPTLRVLGLREALAVQRIEDSLLDGIVLSLSELGEVWAHGLLDLGERGIQCLAGVCSTC